MEKINPIDNMLAEKSKTALMLYLDWPCDITEKDLEKIKQELIEYHMNDITEWKVEGANFSGSNTKIPEDYIPHAVESSIRGIKILMECNKGDLNYVPSETYTKLKRLVSHTEEYEYDTKIGQTQIFFMLDNRKRKVLEEGTSEKHSLIKRCVDIMNFYKEKLWPTY